MATAVGWGLVRFAVPQDYPATPLVLELLSLLLAATVAMILVNRQHFREPGAIVAIAVSAGFGMGVYALLKPLSYGVNGLEGDAWFCIAAVAKSAQSWLANDFGYRDLPAFYPPLYFYTVGVLADALQTLPSLMWRHALIASAFAYPVIFFLLYRRLLGTSAAAIHAVLLVLVFNDKFLYKPHTYLACGVFAWWTQQYMGNARPSTLGIALGGLIAGLLFLTYYYPFFILAVAVAVIAAYLAFHQRTAELASGWPVAVMLGIAALIAAPYWGPLMLSIMGAESPSLHQHRWFADSHFYFWLPLEEEMGIDGATPQAPRGRGLLNLRSILLLVGLGTLLTRNDRGAQIAKALLVGCFGFYVLGYAGMLWFDAPLLHFRARDLPPFFLAPFAAMGLLHLYRALTRSHGERTTPVAIGLAFVGVAFASQLYFMRVYKSKLYRQAASQPVIADPAFDRFLRDELSGKVLLAGTEASLVTAQYPVYSFLVHSAYYSHPAGQFDKRLEYLGALGSIEDPEEFAQAVLRNPFERIDYLLLKRATRADVGKGGRRYIGWYGMTLWTDGYPGGAQHRAVYFKPTVFESDHFARIDSPLGVIFKVNHAE